MSCGGGGKCTCECPPKGAEAFTALYSPDSKSSGGTATTKPGANPREPTPTPPPAALSPPSGTATSYGGGSSTTTLWCRCKVTCGPPGAKSGGGGGGGAPVLKSSSPPHPDVNGSFLAGAGGPRSALTGSSIGFAGSRSDPSLSGVTLFRDSLSGSLGQTAVASLLGSRIDFLGADDRRPVGAGQWGPLPQVPVSGGRSSQVNSLPPAPPPLYGKSARGAGGVAVLTGRHPMVIPPTKPPGPMAEILFGAEAGPEPPAAPAGTWVSLGGAVRRGAPPPIRPVNRVLSIDDSVRGAVASFEDLPSDLLVAPPLSGMSGAQDFDFGPGGGEGSEGMDRFHDGYGRASGPGPALDVWPGDGPRDAGPPGPSQAPFSAITPREGPAVIADGMFSSAMDTTPSATMGIPGQVRRPPPMDPAMGPADGAGGLASNAMALLGGPPTGSRVADPFQSSTLRAAMSLQGKGGGGGPRTDATGATVAKGIALKQKSADLAAMLEQVPAGEKSGNPSIEDLGRVVALAQQLGVNLVGLTTAKQFYDAVHYRLVRLKDESDASVAKNLLAFNRMKAEKHWGKTYEGEMARELSRQGKAAALAAAAQSRTEKATQKRWDKRLALLRPLSFQLGPNQNPFPLSLESLTGKTQNPYADIHAWYRIEQWQKAVEGIAEARAAQSSIIQQRAQFLSLRGKEFHPRTQQERAEMKKLNDDMESAAFHSYVEANRAFWNAMMLGGATPEELEAARNRMEDADRQYRAIQAGFQDVVRLVEQNIKAASAAAKTLLKISQDHERMSKGGGVSQDFLIAHGKKVADAKAALQAALIALAASMVALWNKTHPPPKVKDPPKPDKDGNVQHTSIAFPPEICTAEKLCWCNPPSAACDCKGDGQCKTCEKEWVLPPGHHVGVKGLGNQLFPPGLMRNSQAPAKSAFLADKLNENIYFAGEAVVHSPADSPAGGLGGHGPSIAPFGTPSGAIPYYATPDEAPAGGGGKQPQGQETPSRIIDGIDYSHYGDPDAFKDLTQPPTSRETLAIWDGATDPDVRVRRMENALREDARKIQLRSTFEGMSPFEKRIAANSLGGRPRDFTPEDIALEHQRIKGLSAFPVAIEAGRTAQDFVESVGRVSGAALNLLVGDTEQAKKALQTRTPGTGDRTAVYHEEENTDPGLKGAVIRTIGTVKRFVFDPLTWILGGLGGEETAARMSQAEKSSIIRGFAEEEEPLLSPNSTETARNRSRGGNTGGTSSAPKGPPDGPDAPGTKTPEGTKTGVETPKPCPPCPVNEALIRADLKALEHGTGGSGRTRLVGSEAELKALHEKWSAGGTPTPVEGYDGGYVTLPDGTMVGWRATSKTGGPTIDVKFPSGIEWGVHLR